MDLVIKYLFGGLKFFFDKNYKIFSVAGLGFESHRADWKPVYGELGKVVAVPRLHASGSLTFEEVKLRFSSGPTLTSSSAAARTPGPSTPCCGWASWCSTAWSTSTARATLTPGEREYCTVIGQAVIILPHDWLITLTTLISYWSIQAG